MSIPSEFGGAELDNVSQTIIMEEVSRGCNATAVTMGAHASLACHPIVNFGTEEQKKRFLPKLASGKYLGAFALTEPNAGSDAVNVQTTAVGENGNEEKRGDFYLARGAAERRTEERKDERTGYMAGGQTAGNQGANQSMEVQRARPLFQRDELSRREVMSPPGARNIGAEWSGSEEEAMRKKYDLREDALNTGGQRKRRDLM